jgi:Ser/Thr protein kinase RdoA (MazF antagonist)
MADRFENLDPDAQRAHLLSVAERTLPFWEISSDATLTLLNISENATYRVDDPAHSVPTILRVHRTGYHTRNAVLTELAWMRALREGGGVETPRSLQARDGELIHSVTTDALREERFVVMFEFVSGSEPEEDALLEPFADLGTIAARMHRHARGWARPAYFERLDWSFDGALGKRPNWGDWREGPGLDRERKVLFQRAVDTVESRLARFGRDESRFGLTHADLRLANLLIHNGSIRVIDFDDSGLSWFLYDLATAVTFMEDREDLDELIGAWLAGYRREAPLSEEEEREIPTFLVLRRLTVLAWLGSHSDTDLAREQGTPYTDATVGLVEMYLSRFG